MYLILGVLASDVVIFRFNPSSDNLYVPLSSPEIILYFIVLLWVADKEMTTVYPPSEIDKRQTSPNANVTWKSHSTLTLLATQNYPFWLKYDCPLWLK